MADGARSDDPAVQAQLDRLALRSPGADILGLDRIRALLARLGDPQDRLPSAFHVAGTNGKGSTCAFLRAGLEAAGHRVHVYTSPHLVRFNERIRVAGTLIDDAALAPLLAEVLDVGEGVGASFFEVTTAAAFLAFARTTADACVIEVGLGGRLDATNVLSNLAACGIAQLGVDHEAFLGSDPVGIAREKAGIARPDVPLVTMGYGKELNAAVASVAASAGAPVLRCGRDWKWSADEQQRRLLVTDAGGTVTLPFPILAGDHQLDNCALAAAMLRAQDTVAVPLDALKAMPLAVRWPARMQRLADGALVDLLPPGAELWLDGGHNRAAGTAVAEALAGIARGRPVEVILGMLSNKDALGFLASLAPLIKGLTALPVPDHDHHAPETLAKHAADLGVPTTRTAASVTAALAAIDGAVPPIVLICGSLYLAGDVLGLNGTPPD